MNPIAAIGNVDEMVCEILNKVSQMREESIEVQLNWECICNAGGGRQDHAAQLLSRLIPHLERISSLAIGRKIMIQKMVSDPFRG